MKYPVVLHTDDGVNYGVTVPDVAGCFTAGKNHDEALDMAVEAIFLHLESLLEEGEDIPKANTITFHKYNPDYNDGIWAIVDVDITPLLGKSEKINVTLPHLLISKIDRVVSSNPRYKSRSGFLAEASKKALELA
ncbi:type II toxin-antitoxin system HicB family antitoxin [Marinomonas sp. GJ51-6]|uniref:type II toxin-antitoxin system HicB family antitoxin n=1 Tax=Marinomonas sp. GJ51-6 TaxID=2992802 RepID=UPI0029346065|nr:type II toxin-antitoxin system HicB family antitoxin [Marinomonas sp. GJ51-6]WOD07389.1 type II toxin-antitoxin system HicB family antitoxin [Marinomonas sp. GJ51-6]